MLENSTKNGTKNGTEKKKRDKTAAERQQRYRDKLRENNIKKTVAHMDASQLEKLDALVAMQYGDNREQCLIRAVEAEYERIKSLKGL